LWVLAARLNTIPVVFFTVQFGVSLSYHFSGSP